MPHYVGIDPSLTGFAMVALAEDGRLHTTSTVCTEPAKFPCFSARIDHLRNGLIQFLRGLDVAVVAIEGYSFGSKNGRELAGGLGELIRWTLWDGGYQQFTVPPTTLKSYVCSRGGAPKELMLREVYRKWGYEATDNNDADAFALAKLAHASRQTPMTQQVQTIMEKILHPTKKARKRADVRT